MRVVQCLTTARVSDDGKCCDETCDGFGTWVCHHHACAPTPREDPTNGDGRRQRCWECFEAEQRAKELWT